MLPFGMGGEGVISPRGTAASRTVIKLSSFSNHSLILPPYAEGVAKTTSFDPNPAARAPRSRDQEPGRAKQGTIDRAHSNGTTSCKPCALHTFGLLDADGKKIAVVDWFWGDAENYSGGFIAVHLRWPRGTVQAVPAVGAHVDMDWSTIRLAYTQRQIEQDGCCSIDRELTGEQ